MGLQKHMTLKRTNILKQPNTFTCFALYCMNKLPAQTCTKLSDGFDLKLYTSSHVKLIRHDFCPRSKCFGT